MAERTEKEPLVFVSWVLAILSVWVARTRFANTQILIACQQGISVDVLFLEL